MGRKSVSGSKVTDVTHTINQNERKEQIAQRTARVVTTVVWIRKAKGAWSEREPRAWGGEGALGPPLPAT